MIEWLGGPELALLTFRMYVCCIFLAMCIPSFWLFDCAVTRLLKMLRAYQYVLEYAWNRKEFKQWLEKNK